MAKRGRTTGSPVFIPSTNDPNTGIGPGAIGAVRKPPTEKNIFSPWKWFFVPWPVRSINGKLIIGPMYVRVEHHFIKRPGVTWHHATKKELFAAKLKGEA